eukprot:NODE_207_length_12890_cov_0.936518.p6 type:complete len:164 gc:universal NODE_207_length_12890_cov_0.936518:5857-6348(+)
MEKLKTERTKSVQYENARQILNQVPGQNIGPRRATIQADAGDFENVVDRLKTQELKLIKKSKLSINQVGSQNISTAKIEIKNPKEIKIDITNEKYLLPSSLITPTNLRKELSDLQLSQEVITAGIPILKRIRLKAIEELGKKSEYVKRCEEHIDLIMKHGGDL